MAVLLGVRRQLALGELAGLPAAVKGVGQQMTPDNRLCQNLVDPVSGHGAHLIGSRAGPSSCRDQRPQSGRAQPAVLCRGRAVGWGAARAGPRVQRAWPVVLRMQILLTSATLSLAAAWRLTSARELLGPLALSAGCGSSRRDLVSRGERSAGQSSLEAWAVTPNSELLGGPDRGRLRRIGRGDDRRAGQCDHHRLESGVRSTSCGATPRSASAAPPRWVDQSPVLASLVGLLLHVLGPAPAWTADVLTLAGPLLAFSGAALFTGSVIHPHNLAVPRTGTPCAAGAG